MAILQPIWSSGTIGSGGSTTSSWPASPNKKLLLHFEEDGPFIDSGDTGHTITTSGNVTSIVGAAKWGTKGGYFDGGWLTVPTHADFDFGTGAWGFETWIYPGDAGGAGRAILEIGAGVGDRIYLWYSTSYVTAALYFYATDGASGTFGNVFFTGPGTFTASAWHHVAFQRVDGCIYIYIDGSIQLAGCDNADHTHSSTIYLGGAALPGFPSSSCYMDELLIWSGERLEPKDYNVPTGAYT
jgi:hypothetical protein